MSDETLKIGITGATGFIGSSLLDYLSKNYFIKALSRKSFNQQKSTIEWFRGDLLSEESYLAFLENLDILIHLAQSNAPVSSDLSYVDDACINLLPTLRLFSSVKRLKKKIHIVYPSSGGSIYGASYSKSQELDSCYPVSSYGIQKLTIENYLRILSDGQSISSVILRISNPYGKLLSLNRKQGLIGILFNKLKNKQKIPIIGDPNNVRDYIFLKDLNRAFDLAINYKKSSFEVFNIGSGEGFSVEQVISKIEQIIGARLKKEYIENLDTTGFVNYSVLEISKAKKLLGWSPEFSLDKGLYQMYKENF